MASESRLRGGWLDVRCKSHSAGRAWSREPIESQDAPRRTGSGRCSIAYRPGTVPPAVLLASARNRGTRWRVLVDRDHEDEALMDERRIVSDRSALVVVQPLQQGGAVGRIVPTVRGYARPIEAKHSGLPAETRLKGAVPPRVPRRRSMDVTFV